MRGFANGSKVSGIFEPVRDVGGRSICFSPPIFPLSLSLLYHYCAFPTVIGSRTPVLSVLVWSETQDISSLCLSELFKYQWTVELLFCLFLSSVLIVLLGIPCLGWEESWFFGCNKNSHEGGLTSEAGFNLPPEIGTALAQLFQVKTCWG